jgi:hypothetical protein
MTVSYHMVKIDDKETLCIGGTVVVDEARPGMLWLTNVQGEKLLSFHHSDYRTITRDEAEAHMKALHAKHQAEGSGPVTALSVKTGETIAVGPEPKPAKKNYGFKPFPAFPEPCPKPWNN